MPEPRRKKGESDSSYRSRLVKHYKDKGRPTDQAVAIAHSRVRERKKKKR